MLRRWLFLGVPFVLAVSVASAQFKNERNAQWLQEKLIAYQEPGHLLSAELIGMDVIGEGGSRVGELHSLLFNFNDEIVGAVIASGGFLGFGARHVALSWGEFDVQPSEGAAYVNVSREQLMTAPRFKDRAAIQAEAAARADMRQQLEQDQY